MSEADHPTPAADDAVSAPAAAASAPATASAPAAAQQARPSGGGWFFIVVLPAMALGGLALVWTIRAQITPVATATSPATTQPAGAGMSEEQKIDALIADIGGLQGAVFVRNRTEHTPAEAANHLRRKRRGGRITTARQFIEQLATKSSMSGEPYRIRKTDGTDVPAGQYLAKRLAEIESAER